MELTLCLIKPDAVRRDLIGGILFMIEKAGLKVAGLKMVKLTKEQAEGFYHVHKERPFFGELTEQMSAGPIVAVVLAADNAIARYRELMGATDPAQAADFLARAGADFLAVGIGTAHGVYHAQPKLDLVRLEAIRERVDVPLVLHGASGLTGEDLRGCVARGICKVNFATELRLAYSGGIKGLLAEKPETFDPKELGKAAMARVKETALESIRLCGCAGKA